MLEKAVVRGRSATKFSRKGSRQYHHLIACFCITTSVSECQREAKFSFLQLHNFKNYWAVWDEIHLWAEWQSTCQEHLMQSSSSPRLPSACTAGQTNRKPNHRPCKMEGSCYTAHSKQGSKQPWIPCMCLIYSITYLLSLDPLQAEMV